MALVNLVKTGAGFARKGFGKASYAYTRTQNGSLQRYMKKMTYDLSWSHPHPEDGFRNATQKVTQVFNPNGELKAVGLTINHPNAGLDNLRMVLKKDLKTGNIDLFTNSSDKSKDFTDYAQYLVSFLR